MLDAVPRRADPQLRRQIGYLAEDFVINGRQSARDSLTFLANLRGGAGRSRIAELTNRLELDLSDQIATMSRGQPAEGRVDPGVHAP